MMKLRVGYINYLNSYPLFATLFGSDDYLFVEGVPSELNQRLYRGEVDISPSSSFEYLRHWHDYLIAPNLSISSTREVESVLLFTPKALDVALPDKIIITGESATSVNLLRVLLAEYYGNADIPFEHNDDVEACIARGDAGLLIGDRALRAKRESDISHICTDLGELWYQQTGLPFVFALWIIRKDSAEKNAIELTRLLDEFQKLKENFPVKLQSLAETTSLCPWMTPQEKIEYWQKISYDLDPRHLEGLRLYCDLLLKYGLLPERPSINFFPQ